MPDSELVNVVRRIEDLLGHLLRLHAGVVLRKELTDDFDKRLYKLTGQATSREIQEQLGCSPNRISETWKRLEQFGLVVKDGKTYRKVV